MSAQIANRRLCTALFQTYYVASVEEASPWARRDKTDWSSDVRSSWVSLVGGALEWRIGQSPAAPVGPKEKKGEYCHKTEHRRQCLKCREYVRQRSEKAEKKNRHCRRWDERGSFADRLLRIDTIARLFTWKQTCKPAHSMPQNAAAVTMGCQVVQWR